MKQLPLTRGKFAIVDDKDYDELSQYKWQVTTSGYACRSPREGISVYMHKVILDAQKNEEGDHINGNKLDNRRENLRIATSQQNKCNRGKCRSNTSGLKGVSWHKAAKKWMASTRVNGRSVYLGLFNNKEEAHEVYFSAAKKYHGEFAHP